MCDHAEAIRALLAAGARVNARTNDGQTALDLAKDADCRELLAEALALAALGSARG
jgi:ankyrin repeat protein